MDRISHLSDELLLRIFSLLPNAKDVVATMILSKRWQFLWMFVPKLKYDDSYQDIDYARFSRFVDRSLILHKAPFLKILHFKLGKLCGAGDIHVWIRAAEKCFVRELIIEMHSSSSAPPAILPRSLYTECSMLVTLKLINTILVDASSSVSFPSLKSLVLSAVKYQGGDEFVKRLLSNCHVLENLVVNQCADDNVTIFTVRVPSLRNLLLYTSNDRVKEDTHGFVIDAPSLVRFGLLDNKGGFCIFENNMPNMVKACIDVTYSIPGTILSCITSVERLGLCLTSKDAYPVGSIFCRLVSLNICACETEWLNLLMRMLNDSPKLRTLRIERYHPCQADRSRRYWSEPSSVPERVLSNLETLEWVDYEGKEKEKEVVKFILRCGSCLKKVTINPISSASLPKKLEMLKELSFLPRGSPFCHLSFN